MIVYVSVPQKRKSNMLLQIFIFIFLNSSYTRLLDDLAPFCLCVIDYMFHVAFNRIMLQLESTIKDLTFKPNIQNKKHHNKI